MRKLNQQGSLLIPLILVILLFFGAAGYAVYEMGQAQHYKNDTQAIVAQQVKIAVDKNSTDKDNQFAEEQKNPLKTYSGPSAYGSVVVKFPKTWSEYVETGASNSDTPLDAYFNPGFVPGKDSGSNYALRVKVTSQAYSDQLKQFDDEVRQGTVKIKPYALPKVKSVVGVYITGQIQQQKTGTMIMLPLRDKTLSIWTESSDAAKDFSKYIIPNLTFSP